MFAHVFGLLWHLKRPIHSNLPTILKPKNFTVELDLREKLVVEPFDHQHANHLDVSIFTSNARLKI